MIDDGLGRSGTYLINMHGSFRRKMCNQHGIDQMVK